jgi:hypothetical protein
VSLRSLPFSGPMIDANCQPIHLGV